MINVPAMFGTRVLSDKILKSMLGSKDFDALAKAVEENLPLDKHLADSVADCMKEWAIQNGATHYTHWFQPMTGITAEKHDSFISPDSEGGILMKFSGKELIKGEPDASSFPNGGLRSTFEARGYTAWDPTCHAFIKDNTLCIPTVFCSYSGQVLDKKTPLLRSLSTLKRNVRRVLRFFDCAADTVDVTVGAEQEYFLIDRSLYEKRLDIKFCGRTLFGARPIKGQELEDHYFGNIKPRVLSFMEELDRELWELGILAKTRHNEAAPSQHELAPIFETVNVASDHNQLTMEVMQKLAFKHHMVCLLHEKPFMGVNGSGKHNNWSLTAGGENLLDPGKSPRENYRFLLFLCAVLQGVDKHQDLLRISVATAGNDHRLGASEAPPAIVSVYLGNELVSVLEALAFNKGYDVKKDVNLDISMGNIPPFQIDTTDRNRTSPLAFTGNKFEFRMVGSSVNIACPNVMINTSVTEALDEFASRLEKAAAADVQAEIVNIIKESYLKHKRIVFNGNNYSQEWVIEAEKRGLLNLHNSPQALRYFNSDKNIELFGKYKIYTRQEVEARQEILIENYCKITAIEAATMTEMVDKQILPACFAYMGQLSQLVSNKDRSGIKAKSERDLLARIAELSDKAYDVSKVVSERLTLARALENKFDAAEFFRDKVIVAMVSLRAVCDELEKYMAQNYWPLPTYNELLFSI